MLCADKSISSCSFYACYRTTIKQNGHLQSCEAEHLRDGQISIISSNENYTIMMIHTPGRLLSSNYINRYWYTIIIKKWVERLEDKLN